jgi:hypothetical protein
MGRHSKGILAARQAAESGKPMKPQGKEWLEVLEPGPRRLTRRERRQLSRRLSVPLPRRIRWGLSQRLADPMTNQRRMEVNEMIKASRQRRRQRQEAELLAIVKGEDAA